MQHSKKSPAKAVKKIKPAITCKTAKGSVEVFKTESPYTYLRGNKRYYVREVARNGRVLQVSETFHGKRSILTNLISLQAVLNAALKDKKFLDELGGRK